MGVFDTFHIRKMAQHVFRRGHGIPDKRLMHPKREWASGLLMFAIVLIVGSAMTAQAFIRFRSIDMSGGQTSVVVPKYHAAAAAEVLAVYQAREAAYAKLVTDRSLALTLTTASSTDEVASTTEDAASSTAPLISAEPDDAS